MDDTVGYRPGSPRSGIGTSIVNALLDAAWTTSARSVSLEIICGNDAARALYDRAGFVKQA
ncbi:MAG: GNAT family N-acetyltransferase [Chloroflexi bacterium]|nr:GNAT family N-acetyltransferase [Chloroflexota bacterium]